MESLMNFFLKIKEFFIKPEFHPEAHDEKVSKVIDDIILKGLKKGLKKANVEVLSLIGVKYPVSFNIISPILENLDRPDNIDSLPAYSDRNNMGLSEDEKERLRLPENYLAALAAFELMDQQQIWENNEAADSLSKIFSQYFLLPPRNIVLKNLIKEISEKGLKRTLQTSENEIRYLSRKSGLDFNSLVTPKLKEYKKTEEEDNRIAISGIETLGLQLEDDDEIRRFRLTSKAWEAFATLTVLAEIQPISEDEEEILLREIFNHHTFLPTHDKQVEKLIANIEKKGLEDGAKISKVEIKYLTDMSYKDFIKAVSPMAKMIRTYDYGEAIAQASDAAGLDLSDDEKERLELRNSAKDAFAALGYLSENGYLWGDEEAEAFKIVLKNYSLKDEDE